MLNSAQGITVVKIPVYWLLLPTMLKDIHISTAVLSPARQSRSTDLEIHFLVIDLQFHTY